MYYVSEGVPVGLGNGQKQDYVTSFARTQQHPSPATYNKTTGVNYSSQEHKKPQRSDSLESLLSLNVLAAQLLTDHDDLQSVPSCKLFAYIRMLCLC